MAQDAFTIEGYDAQLKQLKQLMTDDPTFRRRINAVIKKVLNEARKMVSDDARDVLGSDPRQAYKAVRAVVYKRILGGQVNILQKRKAGSPTGYVKPRKGLPSRGGNRWGRSGRTVALEGYEGVDRGFVLRFINAGTTDRSILSYTDRNGRRHDLGSGSSRDVKTRAITGNRGSIKGRNWFGSSSHRAMTRAAEDMQALVDKVIAGEFL